MYNGHTQGHGGHIQGCQMDVQRKIFIPLITVAVLGTSGAAWFFSNHRAASSDELTLYGNVDLQAQLASQWQVVSRLEAGSRPEEISKAQADGVDRHSCVQYRRSAAPVPHVLIAELEFGWQS